ncbi:MAG: vWA domain-containing protein [bacterium]
MKFKTAIIIIFFILCVISTMAHADVPDFSTLYPLHSFYDSLITYPDFRISASTIPSLWGTLPSTHMLMNPNTPAFSPFSGFAVRPSFATFPTFPEFKGISSLSSLSPAMDSLLWSGALGVLPATASYSLGTPAVDYSRLLSSWLMPSVSTFPAVVGSPYRSGIDSLSVDFLGGSTSAGTSLIPSYYGYAGTYGYGGPYTSGTYAGYTSYAGYGYASYGGYWGGGTSAPSESGGSGGGSGGSGVQSGILTAGDIDDNLNFIAFIDYLNDSYASDSSEVLPSVYVADRVTLRIEDASGQGFSNALVRIFPDGSSVPLIESHAGSDGIFRFFPTIDGAGIETQFTVEVTGPDGGSSPVSVALNTNELDENRILDIVVPDADSQFPGSMDLMFVMDTTGSMRDEHQYLTAEFRDIIQSVQESYPEVAMRFGLVVYRDIGDIYVVRDFDFTDSLTMMQDTLEDQVASAGGDYPEAMEQALGQAMSAQWQGGNTARLLFLVADAPPHDENLTAAFNEAKAARDMGIHIHSLAASGVADTAQFIMRAMSSITHGRYLFLTDDSGVGNPHEEPTVPCYVVTRLDQLIIRVIESELAGMRIEPEDDQIIRTVGICEAGVCIED